MEASKRLFGFTVAVLVLNVVAAFVAVIANWPAQFGQVGTDAGAEVLTSGTAISAPLIPVAALLVVVLFVRRQGALGWVAIVAALFAAASVIIGGLGELMAEPTADTPKIVLTFGGLVWPVVGIVLIFLAIGAALERLRRKRRARSRQSDQISD